MSEWTHNICLDCWREQHRDRRPVALSTALHPTDTCCCCGAINSDGIYQRASPEEMPCKGKHADQ